jgi:hypothetical protein
MRSKQATISSVRVADGLLSLTIGRDLATPGVQCR